MDKLEQELGQFYHVNCPTCDSYGGIEQKAPVEMELVGWCSLVQVLRNANKKDADQALIHMKIIRRQVHKFLVQREQNAKL